MNGKDMIALFEYAKVFNKDKTPARRKKKEEINWDNLDLAQVYLKLSEREEKIKHSKKQIELLLKKEEKKDEKKSKVSAAHLAMWMIVTAPITGPMMLYYWSAMFSAIKGMH